MESTIRSKRSINNGITMKRLHFIYLLLVLVVFSIILPQYMEAQSANELENLEVSLLRGVQINEWGATIIYDIIHLKNIGNNNINHFRYGFLSSYKEDLQYVVCNSIDGERLDYKINSENSFTWIDINLNTIVKPKENYGMNVTIIYKDRVSYYQDEFRFHFFDTPIFPFQVQSCNVTFFFPSDVNLFLPENFLLVESQYRGAPTLSALYYPLSPYSSQDFHISYASISTELVKIFSAQREIILTSRGDMEISDSYNIKNVGTPLSTISINIINGAKDVMAYDMGGPIWDNPQEGPQMTITSRQSTINQNETFIFTLKYKIPKEKCVTKISWWGLYTLNATIITPQRWIIENSELTIIFPRGTRILSETKDITHNTELFNKKVFYTLIGVTPLQELDFKIEYSLHPIWISLKPITWLFLIGLTSISLILLRSQTKSKEDDEISPAIDKLIRFLTLQDEKRIGSIKLDTVTKDFAIGALSRKEYKRKRKTIEKRLIPLEKNLNIIQKELYSKYPEYSKFLDDLHKSETEITSINANIHQLITVYKRRRISIEKYNKERKQLNKQLNKANKNIESILLTLKEKVEY